MPSAYFSLPSPSRPRLSAEQAVKLHQWAGAVHAEAAAKNRKVIFAIVGMTNAPGRLDIEKERSRANQRVSTISSAIEEYYVKYTDVTKGNTNQVEIVSLPLPEGISTVEDKNTGELHDLRPVPDDPLALLTRGKHNKVKLGNAITIYAKQATDKDIQRKYGPTMSRRNYRKAAKACLDTRAAPGAGSSLRCDNLLMPLYFMGTRVFAVSTASRRPVRRASPAKPGRAARPKRGRRREPPSVLSK